MVAPTPFPGNRGTPSRILDMSQGLSRLGHDIHVVSYHLKTDNPTDGITVHRIPNIPTYKKMGPGPSIQKLLLLDPLLAVKVWQISNKIDFDLIHGHSFEGFLSSLPTARLKMKKIIYDAHSNLVDELPYYNFINIKFLANFFDKKVPQWADHIIAVSDTLKEFLLEKNIYRNKITVIPTGVNIKQFEGYNPELIREKYNIEEKIKIVMYTGTLANYQRVDYLIDAIQIVFAEYKNSILFLVGNSNEEKYRKMCSERGIADKVIIVGEQPFSQIPLYLAAADIVVSPRTVCPGIPQKLSNYMAAQKAIVSYEGSAKLLKHKINGIVVENGNTKQMAEWIITLLNNSKLRTELGINAKKSLLGKYDWDSLSKVVENIYRNIISEKM
ncbi:MAG: glycosyltransferase family 4 protein [Nitrospirota bacterium]